MREIEETELPGVGVKHEFATMSGQHLGVVTRRSGRREFVLYDPDDRDAVGASVTLTADESAALAELLGGTRLAERVADVQNHIEGLAIDWLVLGPSSSAPGQTITQIDVRAQSGVSIVAVLRGGSPIPAPTPDFVLEEGDTVVVVGTPDGIESAARLLGAG